MRTTIIAASMLLTTLLNAQTGMNSAVDNKIEKFMSDWGIPAAAVAITKDGEMIYNKGFGYSDMAKTKPAEADDLYRIASVSKPITAVAIMKLVEEGKLSLTEKVFGRGKILDQPYYLKVINDKRIYDITINDLLEHTSGWDRNKPCDGFPHSDPAFFPLHVSSTLHEPNPVGDSTLIKFSLMKGIHHAPGTTYSYSNIGYLVLGKVIEKVSKMKYEEYVQQNIFDPLDIHDIRLGKNLLADKQNKEVEYSSSHTTSSAYGNGKMVPWQYGGFNIEAMNAHGGWIASAESLTKLMLAVDGSKTSSDILRNETIKDMNTSASINKNYAKGWSINNSNNRWHTGSMDGTASFVCITNNGYTWAFLLNSRSTSSDAFWRAFDRLPWECVNTLQEIASNTKAPIEKYPTRGITP
jgi:CubicO group peptidase (beta-lactamase class C family)